MMKTAKQVLSDLFSLLCCCLLFLVLGLAFVSWLLTKLEAKTDPPEFNRRQAYQHCNSYASGGENFEKVSVLLFTEQSKLAQAAKIITEGSAYFCPKISSNVPYEDLLLDFEVLSGACWQNLEFEYKLINPKPKILLDQYNYLKLEKIRLDGNFGR
jgi:hypothetical protein